MILKRLANAVREQDWFTVFTEFVIVVAGIFVGLQANEWAQEREDRRQEQAALERLFSEAENSYRLLSDHARVAIRLNEMRRNSVEFVDSMEPVPEADVPLKIGINTLARFPAVVPVSVVYDELRSAGQMQLIRSTAIRDQIAGFHTEVTRFNRLQQDFASSSDAFWAVYKRHVKWDYNPESRTSDILLSTYNWATLRADEEFIFTIIGLLRNQIVSQEGLVQLEDQARALCETLGTLVEKSCSV